MLKRAILGYAAIVTGWLAAYPAAHAGPVLLFEPATGNVIFSEEADQPWYPASLTKLMTGYLTFIALKERKVAWDTKLVVSEKAALQPPSKIGLPVGGELSLDQGVRALIIKSANDVAMMLAETVGGSEEAFVERMNLVAKRLGMSRTHFANPNGLPDPTQVTTARDMGILAGAILRDFPEYTSLFSEQHLYIGRAHIGGHNSLLKTFEGADGMKTGFVCAAGYNVVASATRDGRKLIAVVLGESSGLTRSQRAMALLDFGFENADWKAQLDPRRIDTMPFDPPEAGEPRDMRSLVRAWECGNRGAGPRHRNRVLAHRANAKAGRIAGKATKGAGEASITTTAIGDGGTAAPPKSVSAKPQ